MTFKQPYTVQQLNIATPFFTKLAISSAYQWENSVLESLVHSQSDICKIVYVSGDSDSILGTLAWQLMGEILMVHLPFGIKLPLRNGVMDTLFSFLPPRACQVFVPRSQSKWGKILEKNNFWQIGTVVQLCLNGTERNKLEHLHDIGPVSLRPLSSSEVDLWLDLLLECQLHSSDFPELNKHLSRKSLQDLYLGKGILGRWLIFFHQQPVGVLAIAGPQLEYLGVLPEYRDRGIGQTIMRIIVDEPLNVSQLSVDGRNSSARHIYEKLGWEEMHERCDVFYRAHPLD